MTFALMTLASLFWHRYLCNTIGDTPLILAPEVLLKQSYWKRRTIQENCDAEAGVGFFS
jgi:hypothetical protein